MNINGICVGRRFKRKYWKSSDFNIWSISFSRAHDSNVTKVLTKLKRVPQLLQIEFLSESP